jgi:hypothetical protein
VSPSKARNVTPDFIRVHNLQHAYSQYDDVIPRFALLVTPIHGYKTANELVSSQQLLRGRNVVSRGSAETLVVPVAVQRVRLCNAEMVSHGNKRDSTQMGKHTSTASSFC